MASGITVVLNVFRRPGALALQLEHVRRQTAPPSRIVLWSHGDPIPAGVDLTGVDVISCNRNQGGWARFSAALLATTPYVALLDDDIFPGPRWFEFCLGIERDGDAILSPAGVIVDDEYVHNRWYGWCGERVTFPILVDFGAHAWLAPRRAFALFFSCEPCLVNAEDIQLSAMAAVNGGIPTLVTPTPPDDLAVWGCDPVLGERWGGDDNAGGKREPGWVVQRRDACQCLRDIGWRVQVDG